jgi:hypothetical protein
VAKIVQQPTPWGCDPALCAIVEGFPSTAFGAEAFSATLWTFQEHPRLISLKKISSAVVAPVETFSEDA